MEPREHLLEIWRATARSCWRDGEWHWGGRDGSNSISDAEQLLCVLLPATQIPSFGLDRPDTTVESMLEALRPLGDEKTIPMELVRIATQYFSRYSEKETGRPIFAGGSYYTTLTDGEILTAEQRDRDIVDSYAISVTLSLATIGFVRIFRQAVSREERRRELRRLERLASARLTAAMVGLLRSFSTHVFEPEDDPGQVLLRTLNRTGEPTKTVVRRFRDALQETIASFGEVLIGSGQTKELESGNRLFECGWSWSVVRDAPEVELEQKKTEPTGPDDVGQEIYDEIGEQPSGIAENKPYLYFTVVAVDAIADLFSERTRVLGLLNEEQQRLSRALQLRWDLTLSYWATVATFGDGQVWPLEDPPWQTTDRLRSEYYTLLVTSIVVKDLERRRGADNLLARIGTVLADLANEGRVTRQSRDSDSGIRLHSPGLLVPLERGDEDQPNGKVKKGEVQPVWLVTEFASLLLQRAIVIAGLLTDVEQRAVLMRLADRIWDHLVRRRLTGPAHLNLWDQPSNVFEGISDFKEPSWYYTERVVQGLVSTANLLSREPLVNDRSVIRSYDLLYEAEHLYDMELMRGSSEASPRVKDTLTNIRSRLERARRIIAIRPGSAGALATGILQDLDGLDAVRRTDGTGF
ncbi:SCO2524 family protein [Actinoplanes utahensis]|nr:SCO2524 family protein [Actinoplanes utahensis]GIF34288.1 hypothetical protein Aut01nite_72740 [Actinoplanes utahensis]